MDSGLDIDVDAGDMVNHHGGKHQDPIATQPGASNGGRFCWDCHDPHGDKSQNGASAQWTMIQRSPTQDSEGGRGVPLDYDEDDGVLAGGDGVIDGLTANGVNYYPGIAGNAGLLDIADFRTPGTTPGNGDQALCRQCHDVTAKNCKTCVVSGPGGHPEDKSGVNYNLGCVEQCHPHTKQFGGQASANENCFVCHAQGISADVLDYASGGAQAKININDFGGETANTGTGHGRTGTAYNSGNPAAALTSTGGVQGACYYCHDGSLAHPASDPYALANPFMIVNRGALGGEGDGDNDVCLKCHGLNISAGNRGYDPPADAMGNDPPARCTSAAPCTKLVDTAHYTGKHQDATPYAQGKRCWHCHDPHGDGNDLMMQLNAFNNLKPAASDPCAAPGCPDEVPINVTASDSGGLTANITFTKAGGNDTNAIDFKDFINPAGPLCGRCHTSVIANCNQTACAGHNCGTGCVDPGKCTSCHLHDGNFEGVGTCLGCHENSTQGSTPTRRAVGADFDQGSTAALTRSHHIGTGVPPPGSGSSFVGGALTIFDCVMCHAEGYWDSALGEVKPSTAYHKNGVIDLRNADSATTQNTATATTDTFPYEKDPGGVAFTTWNASNVSWVQQTKNNLDPFCLTCHDSDGASTAWYHSETGAVDNQYNPFNDNVVTNEYDRADRGGVVDIKSKVSGSPPPQGLYSRHPIRGQSSSVYTNYLYETDTGTCSVGMPSPANRSIYCATQGGGTKANNIPRLIRPGYAEPSVVNGGDPTTTGFPMWNDQSVMSCADCHTSDGALGTQGNAHGADSEYLLKDANDATALVEGGYVDQQMVCYRCHDPVSYSPSAPNGAHGHGTTLWSDTPMTLVGSARAGATGGTVAATRFGNVCTQCHGGTNFGVIHGTSEAPGSGVGGATARNAYRFMNGAGMRFYDPQGWTGTSYSCYTVSSTSQDGFGGCTKHSGAAGGNTKAFSRPLSY
jgi:hypothetical protein